MRTLSKATHSIQREGEREGEGEGGRERKRERVWRGVRGGLRLHEENGEGDVAHLYSGFFMK